MTKRFFAFACAGLALAAFAQDKQPAKPAEKPAQAKPDDKKGGDVTATTAKGPLEFKVKNIDGADVDLAKYKGKVIMIVNVASKCGLTPQYEQLEALQKKYGEKGFVILGFPANNFGSQEPGTNSEIKEFCKSKYSVSFDMFAKVSVKGDDTCDLYKFLTSNDANKGFGGEIKWNFTKFLIGKDGKVAQRFEPKTTPDAPEVTKAIEEAIAKAG